MIVAPPAELQKAFRIDASEIAGVNETCSLSVEVSGEAFRRQRRIEKHPSYDSSMKRPYTEG